jgi:hypothetical protein
MSKIMKINKKKEHKKLIKLVSEQETLIRMLMNYYKRTSDITEEIQEEMFPHEEPTICGCEECDELVYPIFKYLQRHEYIYENFDSLTVENINLGLTSEIVYQNNYLN